MHAILPRGGKRKNILEVALAQEKCWKCDDRVHKYDLTVAVVAEHLLLHVVQGRVAASAVLTDARGGGIVQAEGKRRDKTTI